MTTVADWLCDELGRTGFILIVRPGPEPAFMRCGGHSSKHEMTPAKIAEFDEQLKAKNREHTRKWLERMRKWEGKPKKKKEAA